MKNKNKIEENFSIDIENEKSITKEMEKSFNNRIMEILG